MLQSIINKLTPVYPPEEAREIAFWVLEELTGLDRFTLSACKDTKNISNIEIILQRIVKKEPIQYIFGHILWFGLDLKLTSATLIPRPETAELVEWVHFSASEAVFQRSGLSAEGGLSAQRSVIDIGTGSGCIALKLKQLHPEWQVTGIDISSEAIAVAKENASRHHLDVSFLVQDIFQCNGLSGEAGLSALAVCSPQGGLSAEGGLHYDIVVSNPPYVLESEKSSMDSTVLDYEPASALFVPDSDPLRFYRRIAELRLGTWLYFEINEQKGAAVRDLLASLGYVDIEIKKDSYGKERMVRARLAR